MNAHPLLPQIDREWQRPVLPPIAEFAARLAGRAPGGVVAVLFYGSALRGSGLDGLLDFYVLLDEVGAWPAGRLARFANRVLPPNVSYVEERIDGRTLRAKVAVLNLGRFARGMTMHALDTTLWARFSQPCACIWSRCAADRNAVADAVCRAVTTAAEWAALLGPESGNALDYWRALYAETYGAELRVESVLRGPGLIDSEADRYQRLLPAAWEVVGIACANNGALRPRLEPRDRRAAARRWATRRRLGKLLNLLRLLKASFTFEGAMDYVAWKVERHSGVRLAVSPWQRRHPLLAAPGIYWRLRRKGLLR